MGAPRPSPVCLLPSFTVSVTRSSNFPSFVCSIWVHLGDTPAPFCFSHFRHFLLVPAAYPHRMFFFFFCLLKIVSTAPPLESDDCSAFHTIPLPGYFCPSIRLVCVSTSFDPFWLKSLFPNSQLPFLFVSLDSVPSNPLHPCFFFFSALFFLYLKAFPELLQTHLGLLPFFFVAYFFFHQPPPRLHRIASPILPPLFPCFVFFLALADRRARPAFFDFLLFPKLVC